MEAGTVMADKGTPGTVTAFTHSTLSGAAASAWLEELVKSGGLKPCRALILSADMTEEATTLARLGFHVTVVDPDPQRIRALKELAASRGAKLYLVETDAFRTRATFYGTVDLVLDRTFFPTLEPIRRADWGHMAGRFLRSGGRLMGLFPVGRSRTGPPYAVATEDLRRLLERLFISELLEPAGPTAPGEIRGWKGIFRRK